MVVVSGEWFGVAFPNPGPDSAAQEGAPGDWFQVTPHACGWVWPMPQNSSSGTGRWLDPRGGTLPSAGIDLYT
jgi:hypothetical protein